MDARNSIPLLSKLPENPQQGFRITFIDVRTEFISLTSCFLVLRVLKTIALPSPEKRGGR
jgi:hypothetical protein